MITRAYSFTAAVFVALFYPQTPICIIAPRIMSTWVWELQMFMFQRKMEKKRDIYSVDWCTAHNQPKQLLFYYFLYIYYINRY